MHVLPRNGLGTFALNSLTLPAGASQYFFSSVSDPLNFMGASAALVDDSPLPQTFNHALAFSSATTVGVSNASGNLIVGSLSGAGDITKTGPGLLTIGDSNASWSGDLDIDEGTVIFGAGNALGNTNNVHVASGAVADFSAETKSLAGSPGRATWCSVMPAFASA